MKKKRKISRTLKELIRWGFPYFISFFLSFFFSVSSLPFGLDWLRSGSSQMPIITPPLMGSLAAGGTRLFISTEYTGLYTMNIHSSDYMIVY